MKNTIITNSIANVTYENYCAYPDTENKLPAILILPTWYGRNDFVCQIADDMAKLGYIGFAADVYGKAKIGQNTTENQELIKPFIDDRALLREVLKGSLDALMSLKKTDTNKIAAIGFCFGGLCTIDMARNNFPIKGVVSFHGLLLKTQVNNNSEILPKILVLHGNDDPMVSRQQIDEFQKEMTEKNADWQMHIFGKTKHAFTNPTANDEKLGTVYNETSSKRSWKLAKDFLAELFDNYQY